MTLLDSGVLKETQGFAFIFKNIYQSLFCLRPPEAFEKQYLPDYPVKAKFSLCLTI
jgi:hypothetical protein